jgi:pilus assembly protein TadC
MIAVGALTATAAVAALIAAARRDSPVQRRLALLAPAVRRHARWTPVPDRDLRHAALARGQEDVVVAKVVGLAIGLVIGLVAGALVGSSLLLASALGYGGFVAPSVAIERRAAARRRDADRVLGLFIERLDALTAAGRPVEAALAALARMPSGSDVLDGTLHRTASAYALGAPLLRTLAAEARADALAGLATLAASLERARDLGHGSLAVVRDARDAARAAERAAALAAASTVEGKLMLTLVLCYLPALMLLVVVPLFLTLLDGLFG